MKRCGYSLQYYFQVSDYIIVSGPGGRGVTSVPAICRDMISSLMSKMEGL